MLCRIRRDLTNFCCNIRRLEQNKVLKTPLSTAAQLCSSRSCAFWMYWFFLHGSFYSKTSDKPWCPRASFSYRMFTELTTGTGLESPFLLQGTCWFLNSYIRAGEKGLKLFLVNVDFKIKVRKLASKLSTIYTLNLWD